MTYSYLPPIKSVEIDNRIHLSQKIFRASVLYQKRSNAVKCKVFRLPERLFYQLFFTTQLLSLIIELKC
ncbi:MAG: hypothetical protein IJV56_03605, partial [Neisseriaceae bacterium]|nr:hypothetical protein [Neisseriaceae bacterium]